MRKITFSLAGEPSLNVVSLLTAIYVQFGEFERIYGRGVCGLLGAVGLLMANQT